MIPQVRLCVNPFYLYFDGLDERPVRRGLTGKKAQPILKWNALDYKVVVVDGWPFLNPGAENAYIPVEKQGGELVKFDFFVVFDYFSVFKARNRLIPSAGNDSVGRLKGFWYGL